jgi:hypothetical protein
VESIVALVLVSAVLLMLAPVLMHAAGQKVTQEGLLERDAILRGESNRIANLPFQALDAQEGCKTFQSGKLPHSRCIDVAEVSSQEREVVIKVDPTTPLVPTDSVVMSRTNSRRNPFNTGGGG